MADNWSQIISRFARGSVTESDVLAKLPTMTPQDICATHGPNKLTILTVAIHLCANKVVLALLDTPDTEPLLLDYNPRLRRTPLSLAVSNMSETMLPQSTIIKLIRKYPVGATTTHVPGQPFVPVISHAIGVFGREASTPEKRRYLPRVEPVLVELLSRHDAGLIDAQTRDGLTGFEFVMSKRLGQKADRAATNNYHVQRMLSRVAVDPSYMHGKYSPLVTIVCDRMRTSFTYMQQVTTILRSFSESRDVDVRSLCRPLVQAEASYIGEDAPIAFAATSPNDRVVAEAIEEQEVVERVPLTQEERWEQFAHPDEHGTRVTKRGGRQNQKRTFRTRSHQNKRHSKPSRATTRKRHTRSSRP